jgi:CRISPR-associated protein Cmr6
MNRPLYANHGADDKLASDGHCGLWYERFFNGYDNAWKVSEGSKLGWVKGVRGKCGSAAALKRYELNQGKLVNALKGRLREFQTEWNFATGLGNPHPVENGFSWHPTLGTPYIAASAVKGLVRAFIEGGWDERYPKDGAQHRQLLHRWFGSEAKDPGDCATLETQAGGLIFFDAVPLEPPVLGPDVMTPHMGKWYEQGDRIEDIARDSDKLPADWHDPVPVPFLVVTNARFQFAIAPRREEFRDDVAVAMEVLEKALEWLGAGAKTAVGYGCMLPAEQDAQGGLSNATGREPQVG